MNADGTRGVAADVSVGAEADFLIWLAIGLLVAGGILLFGGAGLIYLGARERGAAASARWRPFQRQARSSPCRASIRSW